MVSILTNSHITNKHYDTTKKIGVANSPVVYFGFVNIFKFKLCYHRKCRNTLVVFCTDLVR